MKVVAQPREARSSDLVLAPWRTNCRVTRLLITSIPSELWTERIPGMPRKTFRALAAHLHNARSRWIKTLGVPWGIRRPPLVDFNDVSKEALARALVKSDLAIEELLCLGIRRDGAVPATAAYTWRNLPLDVGHVMAYFVAHEAHHRGQLVLAARQLGVPFPKPAIDGLWQWQQRRTT